MYASHGLRASGTVSSCVHLFNREEVTKREGPIQSIRFYGRRPHAAVDEMHGDRPGHDGRVNPSKRPRRDTWAAWRGQLGGVSLEGAAWRGHLGGVMGAMSKNRGALCGVDDSVEVRMKGAGTHSHCQPQNR